jgi:hypothetical protein
MSLLTSAENFTDCDMIIDEWSQGPRTRAKSDDLSIIVSRRNKHDKQRPNHTRTGQTTTAQALHERY